MSREMREVVTREAIENAELLLRHIHPKHWDPKRKRPMSLAFRDLEMSVDRERLRQAGDIVRQKPQHGVARLLTREATARGQEVYAKPIGEPELFRESEFDDTYNPAHAVVVGDKPRSTSKELRDVSEVVIVPAEFRA